MRILALFAIIGVAGGALAQDLPRYQLDRGQVLTYETEIVSEWEGGSRHMVGTTTVTVLSEEERGWPLLIHQTLQPAPVDDGSSNAQQEDSTLALITLRPDGSFSWIGKPNPMLDPRRILASLPSEEAAVANGWTTEDHVRGEIHHHEVLEGSDPSRWLIRTAAAGAMIEIYGVTQHSEREFDAERGVTVRVVTEITQTQGIQSEGRREARLASIASREIEETRALHDEAERLTAALVEFGEGMQGLDGSESQVLAEYRTLLSQLEERVPEFEDPTLRRHLQQQIDAMREQEDYIVGEIVERSARVDRPSPDWETTDLDGQAHSVLSHRGQVMVLDFWYRGCGWCIRAMPQVKRLAQHFEGRPVSILGMNTDRKEDDARFVIDTMGLNYPTLRATGIPELYGVRGFPTLVIIDQEGIIRAFHVGYSPDLFEKVREDIEELLASGG